MVFLATKAAVAATIVGIGVTFGALSYLARHRQGIGNAPRNFNGSSSPVSSGGAFPFPISFQKDSSQYSQSLPNLQFNLPRFNLSRLFGGGRAASSDCNCKLIYDCSTFFGGASQSFRFRRTCGFQGFQRKICCDEGPFFSTPPPTVAFEEMKSVHAQLSSNCNHGLEGHSTTKCNCDEHRHLFDGSRQDDEGSMPEGSYRAIAGGISTDTVKLDASTISPDGTDELGQDDNEKIKSTSTSSSVTTTEEANRKLIGFRDVNEYFRDDKHEEEDQYQSTFLPIPTDGESVARIGDAFEENSNSTTLKGEKPSGKFPGLNEFFPDGEGSDPSRVLATTTLKSSPVVESEIKSKSSDGITATTLKNLTTVNPSFGEAALTPAKINEAFSEDVELPQGRLAPVGTKVTVQDSKTTEKENVDILQLSISEVTPSTSSSGDMDTTSFKSTDEEVMHDETTSTKPSEEESNGEKNLQSSTPTDTSAPATTTVTYHIAKNAEIGQVNVQSLEMNAITSTTPSPTSTSGDLEDFKTSEKPPTESSTSESIYSEPEGFTTHVERLLQNEEERDPSRILETTTTKYSPVMEDERTSKSPEIITTTGESTERSTSKGTLTTSINDAFTEEGYTELLTPARTSAPDQIKKLETEISDVLSLSVNEITTTSPPSDMEDLATSTRPTKEEAITDSQQLSNSASRPTESAESGGTTTTSKAEAVLDEEENDSLKTTTTFSQVLESDITSTTPGITAPTTSTTRESSSSEDPLMTTMINDELELPQGRIAPGRTTVTHQIAKIAEQEKADVLSLSVSTTTSSALPTTLSSDMEDMTTSAKPPEEKVIPHRSPVSETTTVVLKSEDSTTTKELIPDGEESDPSKTLATTTTKYSQVMEAERTSKSPDKTMTPSSRILTEVKTETDTDEMAELNEFLTTLQAASPTPQQDFPDITETIIHGSRRGTNRPQSLLFEMNLVNDKSEEVSTAPPVIQTSTSVSASISSETERITNSTSRSDVRTGMNIMDLLTTTPPTTDAETTMLSPISKEVEGESQDLVGITSTTVPNERHPFSLSSGEATTANPLPETSQTASTVTPQVDDEPTLEIFTTTDKPRGDEGVLINEIPTTTENEPDYDFRVNPMEVHLEQSTSTLSTSSIVPPSSTLATPTTETSSSEDTLTTTMINEAFTGNEEQLQGRIAPGGSSLTDHIAKNAGMGQVDVQSLSVDFATSTTPSPTSTLSDMEDVTSEKASEEQATIKTSTQSVTSELTSTEGAEAEGSTTSQSLIGEEGSEQTSAPVARTVKDDNAKNAEMGEVGVKSLEMNVIISTTPSPTSTFSDMEDFPTSERQSNEQVTSETPKESSTSESISTEAAVSLSDRKKSDPSTTEYSQVMEDENASKSPETTITPSSSYMEVETTSTKPSEEESSDGENSLQSTETTTQPTTTVMYHIARNAEMGQVDVQSLEMNVVTSTPPSPTTTSSDLEDFSTSEKPSETPVESSTSELISSEPEGSTTHVERLLQNEEERDPSRILETTTSEYYAVMENERSSTSMGTLAPDTTTVTYHIAKNEEMGQVDVQSLEMNVVTTPSPTSTSSDMEDFTTSEKPSEERANSETHTKSSKSESTSSEPEGSTTQVAELLTEEEEKDVSRVLATTTTKYSQVMESERTSKSPEIITTTEETTERSDSGGTVTTDVTSDEFTEELELPQGRLAPGSTATVTDRTAKNADLGKADVLALVNEATSISPLTNLEDLTTTRPTEEEGIIDSQQLSTSVSTPTEPVESETTTTSKAEAIPDEQESDSTTKSSQILESEITSTTIAPTTSTTEYSSSSEHPLTTTIPNEGFTEEVELPQGRIAPARTTVTDQIAKMAEMEKADVQPVITSTTSSPTSTSSNIEDFTTSEKPSEEQAMSVETSTQSSLSESNPTDGTVPEDFTADLLPDGEESDPLRAFVKPTVKSLQVPEGEISTGGPEMTTTTKIPTSTSTTMEATTLSPAGKMEGESETEFPSDQTSTVESYQNDDQRQDDEDSFYSEPPVHSTTTQEPETTSEEPASTEQSLFDDIMSMLSALTTISPEESPSTQATTSSSQEATTVENIAGTLKIIEVPVTSPTTEKVGTGSEVTTTTLQPSSEVDDEGKVSTTEAKLEPTSTVESFTERSTEEPISDLKFDIEDRTPTTESFSTIPLDGEEEIVSTTQVEDVPNEEKVSDDDPSAISPYSTIPPSLEKRMKEVPTTESAPNMEGEETSTMNFLRTEEIRHQQPESPTPVTTLQVMSGTTENIDEIVTTMGDDKITTTEAIPKESSSKDQVKTETDEVTTTESGQSEKPYLSSKSSDGTTTETPEELPEMDDEIRATTPYSHGVELETLEKATELSAASLLKLNDTESADYTSTMDSLISVLPENDGTSTTEQSKVTTTSNPTSEEEITSSEATISTTAAPTTPFSLEGWSTTFEPIVMNDEEVEVTTVSQDATSNSTTRPSTTPSPNTDSSTTTEPSIMVIDRNSTESEVDIEETTRMSTTEVFKAKGIEVTTNAIISSTLDNAMNRLFDTTTLAPMTTEGSPESSDMTEKSGVISRMEAVQTSTIAPTEDVDDSISTTIPPLLPAQDKTFSSTSNSSIDETSTTTSTLSSDMETTNSMDMETTTEALELPQPRIAPSRIPTSSLIQITDGKPLTTTTKIYIQNGNASTIEEDVEEKTTAAFNSEMPTESDMSTTTTSPEKELKVDDLMEIDLTSTPKDEETTPLNTTDSAMEVNSTTASTATDETVSTVTPSPNETHASYGATTEYPDPIEVTLPSSESVSEMPEPEGAATTPSFTFVTTENPDFDDEDELVTEITKSIRREPDTDKTIVRLTSMTSTVRTKIIKVVKAVRSGSESSVSELTTESPSTTERTTTKVESTQEPTTERRTVEAEFPTFDDEAVQQTTENQVVIDDGTNVTQTVPNEDIPMERTTPVETPSPTTENGIIQIFEVLEEEVPQNETTEGTSKYDFVQPTTESEGLNDDAMQNSTETGADYFQEATTLQGLNADLQNSTTERDTTEDSFRLPTSTERDDHDFMETTQEQDTMEDKEQQETTIGEGINDQTTEAWTTEGLLRQTTDVSPQSEITEVITAKTDVYAGTTTAEKESSSTILNLAFDEMDLDVGNDTTLAATTWPSSLEVKPSESVMDLKLESTTGTSSPSQGPTTKIPDSTEPSSEKVLELKTTSSPVPDSAESTSETATENDKGLPETTEDMSTSTFNSYIDDKMIVDFQPGNIVDFDVQESSSKIPEDTTEGTTAPSKSDEEYSSSVLEEVYDAIFGPSGRSARVNSLGQSGKSLSTISITSEARTTTTPPPPFKLEVKIGPYDARSLFASDSTSDEKKLAGEISNVVSQLLLTTHKNFHLLPNFIECAGARARTGRRKTKVLHFDTDNYPWMARIGFREPRGILFPCAGTIISRRYILTSAHCATRMSSDSSKMEILLEGAKLAARGMSELEQSHYKYAVDEVILHQNYDKTTRENDLALIRLSKEIPNFNGSSEVKPICLPFEDGYGVWDSLPEVGETAYLGGWGYGLKNMAAKVEEMEEAAVTIWPNKNCTHLYRGDFQKKITPQHICAYGKVEKDACRGDFGGPLMALMTRQRIFFQIGIVSYGPRCGYGVPGVYVRVSDYLSWILDSMRP